MANGWLAEAVTIKNAYKKTGMDMQLTLFPAGKAGYVTVAGGCPACVSASTKQFKEAYKLAKWFSMDSDEWRNTDTPASRATYEGPYQDYLSEHFSGISMIPKKAMENTDQEPNIHPRTQLTDAAQAADLVPLVQGKTSAAQAAQRMADDLTRMIGRKKGVPLRRMTSAPPPSKTRPATSRSRLSDPPELLQLLQSIVEPSFAAQ